jgi:TRAP-type C4-dicarboxylate transport system substrate-binding protein
MNKSKWDAVPDNVKAYILGELPRTRERVKKDSRQADADAYKKLLARGYTAVVETPETRKEWDSFYTRVCNRLTGRVWPQALYNRILAGIRKVK